MRDRIRKRRRVEKGMKKEKTVLGGAVVINLIQERKGPGAYMIINPHNRKIIFISQFWSLYTLPSPRLCLCFCGLLSYGKIISVFGRELPFPKRHFVMPSTVYCCTAHQNLQQHLFVTRWFPVKFKFIADECKFVGSRVSACGVCARQSGWVSSVTFTNQL